MKTRVPLNMNLLIINIIHCVYEKIKIVYLLRDFEINISKKPAKNKITCVLSKP